MNAAAILNHLWQSTVFAGVAAMVAWALRNNAARVRFAVWLAASLKFLVPFSALAAVGGMVPWPPAERVATPALMAASQPWQLILLPAPAYTAPEAGANPWLLALVGIWLLGSACLALRWWMRWRRLTRLAREATPQPPVGALPVRTTAAAIEPGIFGVFRPVLLLPTHLEGRLTPAQLAAVLAHERCHARRRDNLWSALHMAVETMFWFHPFVWWIGGKLVTERERACDEVVLRQGGDPAAYAGGILQVCRYYVEFPLVCAAGVSGGALKQRIAAILDGAWGRNLSRPRQLLLAALAVVAILGPVAAGLVARQAPPHATPNSAPSFEVVSIRPSAPEGATFGWRLDPTRLTARDVTLRFLVLEAYDLGDFQLSGGPGWFNKDHFDIVAVASTPADPKTMMLMLQRALADSFHLCLRTDTREGVVYSLDVLPGGPKLGAASGGFKLPPVVAMSGVDLPPVVGGTYNLYHTNSKGVTVKITSALLRGHQATAADLAQALASELRHPVLDRTGINAKFDFTLKFATDTTAGDPSDPSLSTALRETLGFTLESGKGPNPVTVVVQAERPKLM